MSSAHRPTFDHARGKERKVVSSISHKRALPSQSKLKFRNKKARQNEEFHEDVHEKIGRSSGGHPEKSNLESTMPYRRAVESPEENGEETSSESENSTSEKQDLIADKPDTKGRSDSDVESASESDNESDSDKDEDEDVDEEEALLREMELIRKEREEAKKKAEEEEIEQRAKASNPLLKVEELEKGNDDTQKPKKKSWRNVKTMSKKPNMSETDRFSNDTLKSDFHKDFLDRYIK